MAHKYLFRGGGTATYLLTLMEALQAQGHRIVPFTVAYDGSLESEYSDYYVSPPAAANEVHLRQMRLSPWKALKLFGRATYSLEAKRKARQLADAADADIAFVNNIYNYMSPSMLHAFKARGMPIVMRVADHNLFCPSYDCFRTGEFCMDCVDRGLWTALRHRCVKRSLAATVARVASMYVHKALRIYDCVDVFITPSEFLRDLLVQAGLPEARVRALPSFCPPANGRSPLLGDGDHILYFGRIWAQKGIDTLIDAYALLRPDVPLVIAGGDRDGEMGRLKRRAQQARVADTVRFVGHKDADDLYEIVRRALFVVVPSKLPDTFPMSVLESFAHGKPVVGARVGGIPEQITPECGLLFEAGNADELAHGMETLLADDTRRAQMGEAASQRAHQVYSIDAHRRELLSIFDGLLLARDTRAEELQAV